MSELVTTNQSTWSSKIKAMGPGILMASAAVGGIAYCIFNPSWGFLWLVALIAGYSS